MDISFVPSAGSLALKPAPADVRPSTGTMQITEYASLEDALADHPEDFQHFDTGVLA
jgi:hypothetical protein